MGEGIEKETNMMRAFRNLFTPAVTGVRRVVDQNLAMVSPFKEQKILMSIQTLEPNTKGGGR